MTALVWKPSGGKVETAVVAGGGPSSKLTTALTVAATTTLAVTALPYAVGSGDFLAIVSKGTWDLAVAASSAAQGATSITVQSFVPTAAFPVGAYVQDLKWPGGQRTYSFAPGIAKDVPQEDAGVVAATLAALQGNLAAAPAPTLSVNGASGGSATWSYKVVAIAQGGDTEESPAGTTAAGQATLTGANSITIARPTLPSGSTGWRVIRTASGGTPASVNVDISGSLPASQASFTDTGIAGTAYTAAGGFASVSGVVYGPKDL